MMIFLIIITEIYNFYRLNKKFRKKKHIKNNQFILVTFQRQPQRKTDPLYKRSKEWHILRC